MPPGKRGKKPLSLEMSEDSSLLEEDDSHVDSVEELEEGTVDFRTMDEIFTSYYGPNAEIDFGETTGIDLEMCIDRAESASTGMQDTSLPPLYDIFESDDENGRELLDTAGLKTTGLEPEEAAGVAYGVAEAESINSYESFDDGDGKETTATAGLVKTTGLEPEQLSGSINRAEGAIGGWQEANLSTELQLSRQLSARRQIPVQAVINLIRMKKDCAGYTDEQLTQGLSHKKPILPSTESTLETRVRGTSKVPKRISLKRPGKKRGHYKKKTADKKFLKRDARTNTANGGESISFLYEQEMPPFKEIVRTVSQPQAGSKDGKAERNTENNPEGEKKVMSGLGVLFGSFRFLARSTTPHSFLQFDQQDTNATASKRRKTTKDREKEQSKKKAEEQRKKKVEEQRKKKAEDQRKKKVEEQRKKKVEEQRKKKEEEQRRKEKEDSDDDDNYDGIGVVPV
jgi:hypothetical protein